jgi:hypothetical protein
MKFDDLTRRITVTVSDLAEALHSKEHHRGVAVRLRTATIGFFDLSEARSTDKGRVWLSIGTCLNNARYKGGTYGTVEPSKLVDVGLTADAPDGLLDELESKEVFPRGWKDMTLEDLNQPYEGAQA